MAAAERVAGEIVASGGRARAVQADVSSPGEVAEMVATIRASLGRIGILVNNAARMDRAAWTELTVQAWDDMMAVNLRGAFLCARAVHPDMRELGGGKIVNVSSVTAELGRGAYLHYITSKAGIIGFTRGLAREVGGDNIQVNCIMPGAIRTEDELERFPDQTALTAELLPLQAIQRRGLPDDVAEPVVFLAGSASSFITGQVVTIDGGWVLR